VLSIRFLVSDINPETVQIAIDEKLLKARTTEVKPLHQITVA
jgi:hypothetical protein